MATLRGAVLWKLPSGQETSEQNSPEACHALTSKLGVWKLATFAAEQAINLCVPLSVCMQGLCPSLPEDVNENIHKKRDLDISISRFVSLYLSLYIYTLSYVSLPYFPLSLSILLFLLFLSRSLSLCISLALSG